MRHRLKITVPIVAPFITGNAGSLDMQFDAAMPRNEDKHFIFPESLIRGVLRDSLYSMAECCDFRLLGEDAEQVKYALSAIFGKSSDQAQAQGNAPGQNLAPDGRRIVHFSDLVSKETADDICDVKSRVTIDPVTGAAKEGHLQTVEMAGKHGSVHDFIMTITLPSFLDINLCRKLLELAFKPVTAIGGSKSAGFGRLETASFDLDEQITEEVCFNIPENLEPFEAAQSAQFDLHFLGPFIVDAQDLADNAIIGAKIVPGAAIKGAIFDALGTTITQDEADCLSDAVFNHAFPDNNAKEQILPLSLGFYPALGKFEDLSFFEDIPLFRKADTDYEAPIFSTDWKDSQREAAFKIANFKSPPHLETTSFTRTAISANFGAAAMDNKAGGQLFSTQAVKPIYSSGVPAKWVFQVHSEQISSIMGLLQRAIDNGLYIGKLKTPANIICNSKPLEFQAIAPIRKADERSYIHIMLRTPTLMFDYAETKDRLNLHTVYQQYFTHIFADIEGVQLERFFAEQETRGGYQALRFKSGAEYKPWILTKPGSVFVLSVQKDAEQNFLAKAQAFSRLGLPPRSGDVTLNWTTCPFIRENGYGDITINPVKHPLMNIKGIECLKIAWEDVDAA